MLASCSPNTIIACFLGGNQYGQVKYLSKSNNTLGLLLICFIDCSIETVYRFRNNLVVNISNPNVVSLSPESILVFLHHCERASSSVKPVKCLTKDLVISTLFEGNGFATV